MIIITPQIDISAHEPKGHSSYGYADRETFLMMSPERFSQWLKQNNEDAKKQV